MCARRRSPFLCLAKERNQRKATPSLRPLRCAAGQTCVARLAGCAAELTARCALRSDNRGESVYEARACCAARATPQAPRRRRSHRGFEVHTGHRCARPPRRGRFAPRARGRAQRWPVWFPLPSARAEERRAWGGRVQRSMHALCALTHCGCLNGAPQARSEFRSAAPRLSTAGCPEAKRRGHAKWGRLSLVPFFGETKKGTAPPGAHPGRQRFQQKQRFNKNQPPARANQAPPAIDNLADRSRPAHP